MDVWHTQELTNSVENLKPSDQQKATCRAISGAKLLWSFLEGIVNYYEYSSNKTHKITVSDKIEDILDRYIEDLVEEDILIITSKIISIMQGRLVEKDKIDKIDLIHQEEDLILDSDKNPYNIYLTIKNGVLIPSAGIDESNVDDMYVLYPMDMRRTTVEIWEHLKKKYKLKKLGIVLTDSHITILRVGVTGIALGWCGFSQLYSYIGKLDIYSQVLNVTKVNIIQFSYFNGLCYGYRDLEEIMRIRGAKVDHSTLQRWVIKFVPLIDQAVRKTKRPVGKSWRMDETYVKLNGKWIYLYRAVDRYGDTVDFFLSEHRDKSAALSFFRKAIRENNIPEKVVIDKSGSNKAALDAINIELDQDHTMQIFQNKCLNNRVEQDHRFIKKRLKHMLGFMCFKSAAITIAGIESIRMIKKGQVRGANNHLSTFENFAMIMTA
ncbi:transposase for insertion sequence-like element IS431mec [Trichonephila clavipes]|uniref:Transposase for insertion sequence-like element IS431mec n=1 Tax=Trichonephila clavipes TaxID=2585209 RepID=A0A8X7BGF7_TRICX|nr:transposase for insertion sequence-like element IS431mec [Trichonephila clavipes]